jgi:hypothetical protein
VAERHVVHASSAIVHILSGHARGGWIASWTKYTFVLAAIGIAAILIREKARLAPLRRRRFSSPTDDKERGTDRQSRLSASGIFHSAF